MRDCVASRDACPAPGTCEQPIALSSVPATAFLVVRRVADPDVYLKKLGNLAKTHGLRWARPEEVTPSSTHAIARGSPPEADAFTKRGEGALLTAAAGLVGQALQKTCNGLFPPVPQLQFVHRPDRRTLGPGLFVGLLYAEATPRGLSILVPRKDVRRCAWRIERGRNADMRTYRRSALRGGVDAFGEGSVRWCPQYACASAPV